MFVHFINIKILLDLTKHHLTTNSKPRPESIKDCFSYYKTDFTLNSYLFNLNLLKFGRGRISNNKKFNH